MSNLDVDTLARFITSKSMYLKVMDKLLTMDPLHPDYMNLLSTQDKLFKQCRSTSMDLGLTISSRCKLVVPKKEEEKPKSEEEKLFGDAL